MLVSSLHFLHITISNTGHFHSASSTFGFLWHLLLCLSDAVGNGLFFFSLTRPIEHFCVPLPRSFDLLGHHIYGFLVTFINGFIVPWCLQASAPASNFICPSHQHRLQLAVPSWCLSIMGFNVLAALALAPYFISVQAQSVWEEGQVSTTLCYWEQPRGSC